jgi:hypothetical protein
MGLFDDSILGNSALARLANASYQMWSCRRRRNVDALLSRLKKT